MISKDKLSAAEQGARRKSDSREAILDQLSLLVEEAEALGSLMGSLPDEFIHGRPFDGSESIGEMLFRILRLDRTVRRDRLSAFLPEDVGAGLSEQTATGLADAGDMAVGEILEQLAAARRRLVELARVVVARAWDRTAEVEGESMTPLDYLAHVVQYDASILRRIAERVYESRPAGSPGLTHG